jgi:hypothetical protein
MRPLWRETSTRQQIPGLKKRSHRPHVHMRVRGPNMGLRAIVRLPQLAASFNFLASHFQSGCFHAAVKYVVRNGSPHAPEAIREFAAVVILVPKVEGSEND